MTIWFTSDTHFYHYNIINFCNRFAGIQGLPIQLGRDEAKQVMNELLIQRWNEKIQKDDLVYHLGDFAFCGPRPACNILAQLNGIKHWIRGNHDYSLAKKPDVASFFQWQRDYYLLKVHDKFEDDEGIEIQFHQPIVLCHFPLLSWDGMAHGAWHLHGHTHGSLDKTWNATGTRKDVGVDTNNLYPYSYEEIKNHMALRTVTPAQGDYHGAS